MVYCRRWGVHWIIGGRRNILSVNSRTLKKGELEVSLKDPRERGMSGVKLVISDAHAGLGAARRTVLGSVPWQR